MSLSYQIAQEQQYGVSLEVAKRREQALLKQLVKRQDKLGAIQREAKQTWRKSDGGRDVEQKAKETGSRYREHKGLNRDGLQLKAVKVDEYEETRRDFEKIDEPKHHLLPSTQRKRASVKPDPLHRALLDEGMDSQNTTLYRSPEIRANARFEQQSILEPQKQSVRAPNDFEMFKEYKLDQLIKRRMQENRSVAEYKMKPGNKASSLLGDQENGSLAIAIIAQKYQPKDIKQAVGKDLAMQSQNPNIQASKQEATESELGMASPANSQIQRPAPIKVLYLKQPELMHLSQLHGQAYNFEGGQGSRADAGAPSHLSPQLLYPSANQFSALQERRSLLSPSPVSQSRIQKAVYFIANNLSQLELAEEHKKRDFTSQKSYNYSDLKNNQDELSYADGRGTVLKDIDTDQEKLRTEYKKDSKLQTVSEALSGSKHQTKQSQFPLGSNIAMQTSFDDQKIGKGTWGSKEKKKSPKKRKKKTVGADKLNRSAAENFVDGQSSALASDMSHIGPAQSRLQAQDAEAASQQAHAEFRQSMYNNSPIEVFIENRSIRNDSGFTRNMQYTTGINISGSGETAIQLQNMTNRQVKFPKLSINPNSQGVSPQMPNQKGRISEQQAFALTNPAYFSYHIGAGGQPFNQSPVRGDEGSPFLKKQKQKAKQGWRVSPNISVKNSTHGKVGGRKDAVELQVDQDLVINNLSSPQQAIINYNGQQIDLNSQISLPQGAELPEQPRWSKMLKPIYKKNSRQGHTSTNEQGEAHHHDELLRQDLKAPQQPASQPGQDKSYASFNKGEKQSIINKYEMNIAQGTADTSNPLHTIQHSGMALSPSSPIYQLHDQNYSGVDLESAQGNLIRNTKSVLNELNSLKELTGEETMSHKSEHRQLDVHNNQTTTEDYYLQFDEIMTPEPEFEYKKKSKQMEEALEKFFTEDADTRQVLQAVANLKPAPVTVSRALLDVKTLPLNAHDRKLLLEINEPNIGKFSKQPWTRRESGTDESIKNKRNYEELYYRARHQERLNQYLDVLRKKMAKEGVDPSSLRNILPKYMESPNAKKVKKYHDLLVIKNNRAEAERTQLETLLEKQRIALSCDGREGMLMESILEEEATEKAEFDQQVEQRLQKIMQKGLTFRNSLSSSIDGDPELSQSTITRDDVMPDINLKSIRDKYLGLDAEQARRWRIKGETLSISNLQDIYQSQSSNAANTLNHQALQAINQSMQRQLDSSGDAESVGKGLPRNLSLKQLVGTEGDEKQDGLLAGMPMSRNFSKATLQPQLHKNLSQLSIETIQTLQDIGKNQKRFLRNNILKQKVKEAEQKTHQIEKKRNFASERQYGRVLNNSSLVLPSLFNKDVADVAVPELASSVKRTPRDQGLRKLQNQRLGHQKDIYVSERQDEEQSRESNHRSRKTQSVNLRRKQDFVHTELNTTRKLEEFTKQILGADVGNEGTSVYYRKELSYLDKLQPSGRINAHSPDNIYCKHLSIESRKVLSMDYVKKSFKEPVILKHALRGPKFELTEFAKYLSAQGDEHLMAKQEASANLETAQILRDMTKEFAFSTASPFSKADVDVLEELIKSPSKITDKRRRRRNKDYAQKESTTQSTALTKLDTNLAQQRQLLQQQNTIRQQYVSANARSLLPTAASAALAPATDAQKIMKAINGEENQPELIAKDTVFARSIQLELEKSDMVSRRQQQLEEQQLIQS